MVRTEKKPEWEDLEERPGGGEAGDELREMGRAESGGRTKAGSKIKKRIGAWWLGLGA